MRASRLTAAWSTAQHGTRDRINFIFHAPTILARANRKLDVGIHLNLVQGRPLLRVPSLTDARTGEFYPLGALARRAIAGRMSAMPLPKRKFDPGLCAMAPPRDAISSTSAASTSSARSARTRSESAASAPEQPVLQRQCAQQQ